VEFGWDIIATSRRRLSGRHRPHSGDKKEGASSEGLPERYLSPSQRFRYPLLLDLRNRQPLSKEYLTTSVIHIGPIPSAPIFIPRVKTSSPLSSSSNGISMLFADQQAPVASLSKICIKKQIIIAPTP